VRSIEVVHDDESDTHIGRQTSKEAAGRLQAASRRANSSDDEAPLDGCFLRGLIDAIHFCARQS